MRTVMLFYLFIFLKYGFMLYSCLKKDYGKVIDTSVKIPGLRIKSLEFTDRLYRLLTM